MFEHTFARYAVNAVGGHCKPFRYPQGVSYASVPVSFVSKERDIQFEDSFQFYLGICFMEDGDPRVGFHCNECCHRGLVLIAKFAKRLGSPLSGEEIVRLLATKRDPEMQGYCDRPTVV